MSIGRCEKQYKGNPREDMKSGNYLKINRLISKMITVLNDFSEFSKCLFKKIFYYVSLFLRGRERQNTSGREAE